ncbi:DUF5107 domain-containing protein [Luethyella okanaganae]|uniref:DUF5107 domain-containing protein n=1 Tax=Luethyella okanaganae TaxID=69372 RepID=A0ABW1VET3_9MICO
MTELRLESLVLPTAPLGEENPLPPLFGTGNVDFQVDMSEAPDVIRDGSVYGRVLSVAPYLMQDGYGRDRRPVAHPVAVLENELLTATFLLDQGGRLRSLIHRPTGRELLFRNEVLQPANLALRNAWFAGGIEWNVGTIGHAPGTYAPMHAGRLTHPDGTPVLRLWEFDRIRGVAFQIDFHLPPDADTLFVHPRISNPRDEDVPTYWWSNIAVPQTEKTRVVASADSAWSYAYSNRLETQPVSALDGSGDVSYPSRSPYAADYFFDTAGDPAPWIASLDEDGIGLGQTSTCELRGRKLFLWGKSAGGERWQEWLSEKGQRYIEIQAGLARTQFEHVLLPAADSLSWVEAYGRIDVPATEAHGSWEQARDATGRAMRERMPIARLREEREAGGLLAQSPVEEILHTGSGWGALERRERSSRGDRSLSSASIPFGDDSLGALQRPWLDLLERGAFPPANPADFPESMQIAEGWNLRLAASGGWLELAQRGSLLAARGDLRAAEASWLDSLSAVANVLALRNLGALNLHRGDGAGARNWYLRALELAPANRGLVIEALRALRAANDFDGARALIAGLSPDLRGDPRIRLAEAALCIESGDLEGGGDILQGGIEVPDLREGENVLSDLWIDYRTAVVARERSVSVTPALRAEVSSREVVPRDFDFRMVISDSELIMQRS